MIYTQRGRAFQDELAIQFIEALGTYPLGTILQLDTGEVAVVVGQDEKHRLKPRIIVVTDEAGQPIAKKRIANLGKAQEDAEVISHQLMLRAGLIRRLASGLYSWLPLGLRVLQRVEAIVREEMNKAGALEVLMPVTQPAEIWEESGRWEQYGPELLRLKDRHDRAFCLGPTHEEVITDLIRNEISSYRQLPANFYQIQTKFRDEIRPRFGVMRSREFIMKDAYSFHIDQASLQQTYEVMHATYSAIFERIGLDFRPVAADTGSIGGSGSHEFHVLADSGEDDIAFSDSSDYAANIELAEAVAPGQARGAADGDTEKVATPGKHSIAEVCNSLGPDWAACLQMLSLWVFLIALLWEIADWKLALSNTGIAVTTKTRKFLKMRFSTFSTRFATSLLLATILVLSSANLLAQDAQPEVDAELVARLKNTVHEDYGFEDRFEAEVFYTSMEPRLQKYMDDPEERHKLLNLVHREAVNQELEPALVLAVITVESRFDRFAVSRARAQGLMQVMSFWKNEIGRENDNLIDTQTNLRYGTTILKHYMDVADGNWTEALARYNGSYPKRWYAERVFDALEIWR
eukprot:g4341.t1